MLEVLHLSKNYGDFVAVRDVTFTLKPGDVFGFIGSNGAGKTTTIRMLATLLSPGGGSAKLNGVDVGQDPMAIRRMIGYMPDFFGLYDDVRVWEYLDFFATICELPVRERPAAIDRVLELTDLTAKRKAFVHTLSRGMQQRLCLAKCLIHDPSLLLLDEPASGLDPRARAELKELILGLGQMGKIVIVSSHIIPELSGFCNTVGIIEKGTLITYGPMESVVKSIGQASVISVRVLSPVEETTNLLAGMENLSRIQTTEEGLVTFEYHGDEDAQADLLRKLIAGNVRVVSYGREEANLQDVFLTMTAGKSK